MTGTAHDRGERVLQDLRPRRRRDPDEPGARPGRRTPTSSIAPSAEKFAGDRQGNPRDPCQRAPDPGRDGVDREERKSWPTCSADDGIEHEVLNAKHHEREAEIVAQAGRKGR